jgi:hypothetical protein
MQIEDKKLELLRALREEAVQNAQGILNSVNSNAVPLNEKASANDISENLEETKKYTEDEIEASKRFNKNPGEITESDVQKHLVEKTKEEEEAKKAKEALMASVLGAAGISVASNQQNNISLPFNISANKQFLS